MSSAKDKKALYMEKFHSVFEKNSRILVVTCDNIGSSHMQSIRLQLRGLATLVMGKNTLIRKTIRAHLDTHPQWAALLPYIVGNVGLVFTDGDLSAIRKILVGSRVPAVAKVGIIAPQDVLVPKGQTTLEPTKTSFLQQLNIASKINKGTIEILNDIPLIKAGEKVGPSQAQLLQMLDIRPFTYGLTSVGVYDNGSTYDAEVLDLTDADLLAKFAAGVANVASLSLATGVATTAAFPHAVINGYKNLLCIAVATDYCFKQAQKLKDLLDNPEALAAATRAAAAPAGGAAPAAAKVEEAPKKEEKPESDDMGFDLFG